MADPDPRIKSRRDIINTVMLEKMDEYGIDTNWGGRRAYLQGVIQGVVEADVTPGSELALTLIELHRMIRELDGLIATGGKKHG